MAKLDFLLHKRKKRRESADAPQNEYYEKISAGLGVCQVVVYMSLFAFVILSFFRNTNLITYENFYFFFKDLNASVETVDAVGANAVTYPTSQQQSFAMYRKGLAVAGRESVMLFTATGRQTVSQIIDYQSPVAVGSGRYLLVYDLGGVQYSLYNSYAQIQTGKTDRPIRGAAISENGMYALITDSAMKTSEVLLFSNRFALINRYDINEFVMDVAINQNGTRIAILTSSTASGLFQTKLWLYKPREETGSVRDVGSELGLSCAFTDAGGVSVLCGNSLVYLTEGASEKEVYRFNGKTPICTDLNRQGAVLCLKPVSVSQKNQIIVFDKNGKMLYNKEEAETVETVGRQGDGIFYMTASGIFSIRLSDGAVASYPCDTDKKTMLVADQDEILLCSPQKAEYIRLNYS